ncbi:hypothetical protein BLA29_002352 [Euroglyphus maynei]|uniref:Uncharacterized protein n=1 Tax=Euroglyphus maynei TaxID=6958 RepID=A0A1Y3BAE5_EURMA|nr:hypothetical protein BLA29_002352 [Euroglyphus maynei]
MDVVDQTDKTESFENLMQKIEEAAAERPIIRSISPMQKTTSNLLMNQMLFNDHHHHNENKSKFLTTFKRPSQTSKLIEFTENPDYSKYYLPQV